MPSVEECDALLARFSELERIVLGHLKKLDAIEAKLDQMQKTRSPTVRPCEYYQAHTITELERVRR